MSFPYMKFYVSDYLSSTRRFSTIEHGAYIQLLFHMWEFGPWIENDEDELRDIMGLTNRQFVSVWKRLSKHLRFDKNQLTHDRLLQNLHESERRRLQNSENGKLNKGKSNPKSKQKQSPEKANAKQMLSKRQGIPEPEPEPYVVAVSAQAREENYFGENFEGSRQPNASKLPEMPEGCPPIEADPDEIGEDCQNAHISSLSDKNKIQVPNTEKDAQAHQAAQDSTIWACSEPGHTPEKPNPGAEPPPDPQIETIVPGDPDLDFTDAHWAQLMAAVGDRVANPAASPGILVTATPKRWLTAYDWTAVVIPTLTAWAARRREKNPRASPVMNWNYFSKMLADAQATADRPLPKGEAGNAKNSKNNRAISVEDQRRQIVEVFGLDSLVDGDFQSAGS